MPSSTCRRRRSRASGSSCSSTRWTSPLCARPRSSSSTTSGCSPSAPASPGRRLCCAGPGCVCGPPKICTCQPHGAAPPRVCRYAEFKKLNAEVVGVSVDSAHAHLAWCVRRDAPLSCARRRSTRLGRRERSAAAALARFDRARRCRTRTPKEDGGVGKVEFPLLSDMSKDISRKFNVLVENPEDEHYGVTMRGTFIIDPQVSQISMHACIEDASRRRRGSSCGRGTRG